MKEKCLMDRENIENLLNLSMDASLQEREKSLELNVGFDAEKDTWQVIVKFFGTAQQLQERLAETAGTDAARIAITNLSGGYAILELPQQLVDRVAALPEIEYMEKPKLLFFAVANGKRAACILPLQVGGTADIPDNGRNHLTGRGVLAAVIDSGIDYAHPDFRNADGTTRILDLWDQTIPGGSVPDARTTDVETTQFLQPPDGFLLGTEFSSDVINLALNQPTEQLRYTVCPSRDRSGHGTHVSGIFAGNGTASLGRYRGVAYESPLVVVKLGTPGERSFPRTTELMQAVDYCIRKGSAYGMPIVLNLSFGNSYGSHTGTSLLETFLDDMAGYWKNVIAVGSGNDGAAALHTSGVVQQNRTEEVEFSVSPYERTLNLQIWKNYVDEMEVSIVSPSGQRVGPIQKIQGPQRFRLGNTEILLYYGEPSPYSIYQEIYLDFLPAYDYVDSGIWRIQLIPQKIVTGNFDMWLPSGGVLNENTGFLFPTENTTLTIPSTAEKVLTVGAYDAYLNSAAPFSGRGYTFETGQIKPDLVAPGVDITSCAPGGGYVTRSGTSMATPFAAGGAALLMEWGIVNGNDPYLYGEKMKAVLIRGARRFAAAEQYPNPQLGADGIIMSS